MRFNVWIEAIEATVTVDMKPYADSVREYLYELVAHNQQKQEKLKYFSLNKEILFDLLSKADLGKEKYTKLVSDIQRAIEKRDDMALLSLSWELQSQTGFGIRDWNRNATIRQAARMLSDYADKLSMAASRYSGYSEEQAEQDIQRLVAESHRNLSQIAENVKAAIARIPDWGGIHVVVKAMSFDKSQELRPITYAEIEMQTGNLPLSFTYFTAEDGKIEIDDILEAGDDDFFTDSKMQSNYFNLIQELKNPGASTKKGKVLTLYTARPVQDRKLYDNAKEIPVGLFLTSKIDSAEGIGRDMGGRDIWKIKIDSRYLMMTLNTLTEKQYQVVGANKVPVIRMELIAPYN
jgi:hypothetical protein